MPNYPRQIADALKLNPAHVAAAIALLDEGNTLPFIARYRKEQTGTMSDETLQQAFDLLGRLRALDERRETIVKTITEQGKLTPELQAEIAAAETLSTLEDLYAPYKPKRRTRATVAREKGLQGLADLILEQIARQIAGGAGAALPERGRAHRRGRPGRGARHRGRGHQRERQGARRIAQQDPDLRPGQIREDRGGGRSARRLPDLLRVRVPHRPPAPLSNPGDQSRRAGEGPARAGGGRRARLGARDQPSSSTPITAPR